MNVLIDNAGHEDAASGIDDLIIRVGVHIPVGYLRDAVTVNPYGALLPLTLIDDGGVTYQQKSFVH